MKKILVFFVAIALVVTLGGIAGATTFTFQPTPADLWDLDHYKYYTWGVDWAIPDGEHILEATLTFDNIRNYNWGTNDLWVTALDSAPAGASMGHDNQGGGNYFAGQGILLNHWRNLPGAAQDITYDFSASEIAGLTGYLADGNFGLGFDPDCHFYNSGISLTIETAVPIPGAVWLMFAGLAGILGVRKKVRNG